MLALVNPVRIALAVVTMIVGYVAHILPTSWPNAIVVCIAAIVLMVLYIAEYGRGRTLLIAAGGAYLFGILIAFILTGAPPA